MRIPSRTTTASARRGPHAVVEMSLRRSVGPIDLLQLHWVDPNLTIDDRVGVLVDMKAEGKIRHVGLSEADVDQLKAAQKITPIMYVQNLANRSVEPQLDEAEAQASPSSTGYRRPTGCQRRPASFPRHVTELCGYSPGCWTKASPWRRNGSAAFRKK